MRQTAIDQLQRALKDRGWTQVVAARELDTQQPTLSQILSGRRRPSPELAFRIEAALGVDARLWFSEAA